MNTTMAPMNWREAMKLTWPKEHGSWSLAFEPVALGLLVAPSLAGVALAWTVGAIFFLRRPTKLALTGRGDPRQGLAIVCGAALIFAALAGLLLMMRWGNVFALWPLVPAALAAGVFAWFDEQNEGREGVAEVFGAAAFGVLPATFATLAGWPAVNALALALVMLVRGVPTVLVVRTCVRRRKGRDYSVMPALLAAGAGVGIAGWLLRLDLVPWTALVLAVVLALRAAWLVTGENVPKAKVIGIFEAALGVAMVLALAGTWPRPTL